jgi:hypothetical protein
MTNQLNRKTLDSEVVIDLNDTELAQVAGGFSILPPAPPPAPPTPLPLPYPNFSN